MKKLSSPLSLARIRNMRRVLIFIVLIIIASYLARGYFFALEQRKAGTGSLPPYLLSEHWTGHVQEIISADSLSVLSPYGEKITIRLYGIMAPSRNEPGGPESIRFVAGMTHENMITVIPFMEDSRGRLIANVHSLRDGSNISQELVRNGLAAVSREYCRHEICMYWFGLEEDARRKEMGMWIQAH